MTNPTTLPIGNQTQRNSPRNARLCHKSANSNRKSEAGIGPQFPQRLSSGQKNGISIPPLVSASSSPWEAMMAKNRPLSDHQFARKYRNVTLAASIPTTRAKASECVIPRWPSGATVGGSGEGVEVRQDRQECRQAPVGPGHGPTRVQPSQPQSDNSVRRDRSHSVPATSQFSDLSLN